MKLGFVAFLLLFSFESFSISLIQEEKVILCQSEETSVLIEARDRYFEVNSEKFRLVEFLDSAILARSENNQYAIIQMLPKNEAVVIRGTLINFVERDCDQIKAHKKCSNDGGQIKWSPTWLEADGGRFPLVYYGVYPNDGTGFIAVKDGEGLSLVDFGSKFIVVSGQALKLNCRYQAN